MRTPFPPHLGDDLGNVASIFVSAVVTAVLTSVVLAALKQPGPQPLAVTEVTLDEPAPVEEVVDPTAGADRIYGRVVSKDGAESVGYIRWNGADASWADVLHATARGSNALSGVRFGHVARIEPIDARTARLTLRSGEVLELSALLATGSSTLAPIGVESPELGAHDVVWRDVETIELLPEPLDARPTTERIHGTVTTRTGMVFTGYVSWDRDERFGTDLLDGYEDLGERAIPFERIAVVRRQGEGARVTLTDGQEVVLGGTNDVDEDNRGIVISDPALGVVVVPWERFGELRVHPRDVPADHASFDGGTALHGTVVTHDGRELTGRIRWDRDEAHTWDLLDGRYEELQMRVELGQVARIRKFRLGSLVDLRDGRTFYLFASQDVNWTNRGIEVHAADERGGPVVYVDGARVGEPRPMLVRWEEFSELRLQAAVSRDSVTAGHAPGS